MPNRKRTKPDQSYNIIERSEAGLGERCQHSWIMPTRAASWLLLCSQAAFIKLRMAKEADSFAPMRSHDIHPVQARRIAERRGRLKASQLACHCLLGRVKHAYARGARISTFGNRWLSVAFAARHDLRLVITSVSMSPGGTLKSLT